MPRTFIVEVTGHPELPALMLLTIQALKEIGGSGSITELDEKVVELEGVTEEEQQIEMPNDTRLKLNYYLAWARTYLKRGNALENSRRGIWSLTEKGERIISLIQCQRIHAAVQKEERERAQKKREVHEGARTSPIEEQHRAADEDSLGDGLEVGSWRTELLQALGRMDPSAFERLAQRILREAGFLKVEVRGKSGDGGIDGIGVLSVNLVSFQVYFQCKRWKGSVPAKEIRDFRGALQGRADKGLFITTGSFTSQASDEATRDGAIAIDLIDGNRLCDLLKKYELGVSIEMIERVHIDTRWFSSI